MMAWFVARKERKDKEAYSDGYDWAAGALMRGEEDAESLHKQITTFDFGPFEEGATQAMRDFSALQSSPKGASTGMEPSTIKADLIAANMRGVCPPQNWTHRAIDEISRLERVIAASQPSAASGRELHSLVAGALFDFMGGLTTQPERLVLSACDEASPAVAAIEAFAKKRGLDLTEANVSSWSATLTGAAPADANVGEPLKKIQQHLQVMLASANQLGDDDCVTGYQIKTGALHQILGVMAGAGFHVTVPIYSGSRPPNEEEKAVLANFRKAMDEEAIPAIVETMRNRAKTAAEISHVPLSTAPEPSAPADKVDA